MEISNTIFRSHKSLITYSILPNSAGSCWNPEPSSKAILGANPARR